MASTQDLIHVQIRNEPSSCFFPSSIELSKIFWEETNQEVIVLEPSDGKITRYKFEYLINETSKVARPNRFLFFKKKLNFLFSKKQSIRRENMIHAKFSLDDKYIGILCSDKLTSIVIYLFFIKERIK